MIQSVLERLTQVHPEMEIWWDSSPLVFKSWVEKMVEKAPPSRKDSLKEELNRIYNLKNPSQSLIRGCTTNPPLSLAAVNNDLPFWNNWVDNLIRKNKGLSQHEYFWTTYKEIIRRGAEMMMPIWKASKGRYGYISGQLDPRLLTETDKMIEMAKEIRAISPNLMIKVPASTQGVEVVKVLTSMAIPTNVTTCFTLPQIWAVAQAAKTGVAIAQKNHVDMGKWRAVITMMIGRLTEHPVLDEQAKRRGITLSWTDKHWLGIHVFRKAYKLLQENNMPSKMLACSMRDGPQINGKYHFWDVEKIAGNIVYTMPSYVLEPLFEKCGNLTFKEEILYNDVPQEVLDKMNKIPYVRQSWDENGMEVDQFNLHPATISTAQTFSQASVGLEEYVGGRLKKIKGEKNKSQSKPSVENYYVPWIKPLKMYVSEHIDLAWQNPKLHRMMSNENPIPPSAKVLQAIAKYGKIANRYPDQGIIIRSKLAKLNGLIGAENVVLGNGSSEIFDMIYRTFLTPGDEVIQQTPCFGIYKLRTDLLGGKIVSVPMIYKDKKMLYDAEGIIKVITDKTKIITIANPNNPTGNFMDKKDFIRLAETGIPLVIDEAYIEYAGFGKSQVGLIRKYENVIITRTFSKAYGLAGLRFGYLLADKEVAAKIAATLLPWNVGTIVMWTALAALKDQRSLTQRVKYNNEQIAFISKELKKIPGLVIFPSFANYILFDAGKSGKKGEDIIKYAQERGIILRGEKPKYGSEGWFRVTIGTREENRLFVNVIKDFFAK